MNRASKIIQLNYARRFGLTGKGIGIANFDTGIGYHPDLCNNYSFSNLVAFMIRFPEKNHHMMTTDMAHTLPVSLPETEKPVITFSKALLRDVIIW